ncbi:MAG: hypothetical protein RJA76_1386 [Bacteroidota bacterium]|jgi:hypothetical protein
MKWIIILVIFSISTICNAQTKFSYRGKIVDQTTNEPIPFAHIFFNNTSYGTQANEEGEFQLVKINPGQYQVHVSSVGYENKIYGVKLEESQTNLVIFLQESSNNLLEVKVSAGKDVNWERSMKIFERELLGRGYSKKEIAIRNREIIEFENNGNLKRNFKAKAKEPLMIENNVLGYIYKGFLTEFEITNKQTRYTLSGYFEPMSPHDFKELVRWIRKRRFAYEGSLRHFLSAFIANQLEEQGFYTTINVAGKNVPINPNQYIKPTIDSAVVLLDFPGLINCYYRNSKINSVLKPQSTVYCMKSGLLLNPLSIETNGKMADFRMAEELPTDYVYQGSFQKEKSIEEKLYYLNGKISR